MTLPTTAVAEATGPGGAIVTYTASVTGAGDGSDGRPVQTVTCSPPSLSLFPIGTTTVSCVGSEGSTGSFPVTVTDHSGPILSLPQSFTIVTTSTNGQPVTYNAAARDLVDGSVPVLCSPASGSTFPFGDTTVTCSASDSRGNTSSGAFVISLASSPPPPAPNPLDITAEATGPNGARVAFTIGDPDDGGRSGIGCTPAPGSFFPLGATTVQCPSASFTVTVVDTTGPELSLPGPMTVVSAAPTAVSYTATAFDLVDGSVAINCSPASGSTFPLGLTTVSCSASDSRGNSAAGTFAINVVTTPPNPGNPPDIVVEATGPSGAAVNYATEGGVSCSPPSGSTFPLGTTNVACTNSTTFKVTVVDTTAPVLTLPASLNLNATSAAGAVGTFTATATDLVSGSLAVTCTPPSGSTFPLGTTTVLCSASDAAGNSASGHFDVTVVDADPPAIVSIVPSPATLWPPDQKLAEVSLAVTVTDNVDAAPLVQIFAILCNEQIQPGDAIITGPLTVKLRADRNGNGNGRIYTIFVEAIDAAGNRSVGSTTVTVPHDQRKRSTR